MSLETCISTIHVNILIHTHTLFKIICLGKWQNEYFTHVQPVISMSPDKYPSLF